VKSDPCCKKMHFCALWVSNKHPSSKPAKFDRYLDPTAVPHQLNQFLEIGSELADLSPMIAEPDLKLSLNLFNSAHTEFHLCNLYCEALDILISFFQFLVFHRATALLC
jgi:hypothetical protein